MFDATKLKRGDVIEYLPTVSVRGWADMTTKRGWVEDHVFNQGVDVFRVKKMGTDGGVVDEEDVIGVEDILGFVEDGALIDYGRADWDHYFMSISCRVASRSTCDRKHVGSVIVKNKTILSTGYNGSIRGVESCRERGHMMEDDHCVRTVHAEANAIVQAAKNGVLIDGGELYTTASPCWWCFKLIANAGIVRIIFGELYRDRRIGVMARRCNIELKELQT